MDELQHLTPANILELNRQIRSQSPTLETLCSEWRQMGRCVSELHDLAEDLEALAVFLRLGLITGDLRRAPSTAPLATMIRTMQRMKSNTHQC